MDMVTVSEATGMRRDLDRYETYYRHLVLRDDGDAQIAGAYRIGKAANIIAARGVAGLYTGSLVTFTGKLPGANLARIGVLQKFE